MSTKYFYDIALDRLVIMDMPAIGEATIRIATCVLSESVEELEVEEVEELEDEEPRRKNKKKAKKVRNCGICGKPGHRKENCPVANPKNKKPGFLAEFNIEQDKEEEVVEAGEVKEEAETSPAVPEVEDEKEPALPRSEPIDPDDEPFFVESIKEMWVEEGKSSFEVCNELNLTLAQFNRLILKHKITKH